MHLSRFRCDQYSVSVPDLSTFAAASANVGNGLQRRQVAGCRVSDRRGHEDAHPPITDGVYSLVASSLRGGLVRGRGLPFVQRYVAGTVFIGLGLVAATASAGVSSTARSR